MYASYKDPYIRVLKLGFRESLNRPQDEIHHLRGASHDNHQYINFTR